MRVAAKIGVLMLAAACTPAGPAPADRTGDRVPPVAPPEDVDRPPDVLPSSGVDVRIGLAVDEEAVRVGATAPWQLVEVRGTIVHEGRAGEHIVIRGDDGGLEARSADGRRIGSISELTRVRLAPGAEGHVLLDTMSYRGILYFLPTEAGGVTAINALDLEAYLLGVVPREIPMSEVEAVKAQAVAARTYAIGHMGRRGALGFDFYPTVSDQVYGGAGAEHPVAMRAIRETAGEILTYDGAPIQAYYHSTCGGRTAAIDQVWDHAPLPYLSSVSDARPEGGWYCEGSNRFRWTQSWSGAELEGVLSRYLVPGREIDVDEVKEVEVRARTTSGRVADLHLVVDDRSYSVGGDSVRRVLRPTDGRLLNSSLFSVETERSGDRVTRLVAEGAGWGHGIGMCQIGAMGRAADGHDYRSILRAYYRGAEITRLN